ncbi:MAG: hypothetical protein ACOC1U_04055 [Spirochaetota bacterium]
MSTTPIPSDLPYTVVGRSTAPPAEGRAGVSLLLLHRAGRPLRAELLAPFAESGADEVICVLGPAPHYEVEQLASRVERTRFILLGRDVSTGEQINIGMREARTPYVITLWSDMYAPSITERVLRRVAELDSFAVVPIIRTERNETVPSIIAPAFFRSLFRTIPTQPGSEGTRSLYVYGDIGVFDRDRFNRVGGYDPAIRNAYWQRVDLGMRANLWGEQIVVLPSFRVQTSRPLPADDTTPDASYARFHLKNLSVRFVRDQGRLPLRQLLAVVFRSGLGLTEAIRHFRETRRWVRDHAYRFTQDARRLTELWEVDE